MKKIQILGTGCAKCKKLTEHAETAAKEAGIEFQLEKVTEMVEIMKFKVMSTPALVVDGVVKFSGKLASVEEIKAILKA